MRDYMDDGYAMPVRVYDDAITLKSNEDIGDWYTIEKAEHGGGMDLRAGPHGLYLWAESRICDADIEGPLSHMVEIAAAIRDGVVSESKRCAVAPHEYGFVFWSPRNSEVVAWVSREHAEALAAEIEMAAS